MSEFNNNPFEKALKDFQPLKAEEPAAPAPAKKAKPVGSKREPANETKPANQKAPEQTEQAPDQPWRHPETALLKEDQAVFELLCRMIGLRKKGKEEKRYWRVRDCISGSHIGDVSYEINRWLGSDMRAEPYRSGMDREKYLAESEKAEKVRAIVDPLLRRGYEADAVHWLLSRTLEKMKFGNGSRELRLEKAKASAKKAGKIIEEIAKAHGLEYLLV